MRMHPASFLRDARDACDRFGVPLVADEVMTGFGRTGTLFASAGADVAPDVMCVAKGITGGILPLAATFAREHLFEAFLASDRSRFFPHGHSMTANPIGCAVALESLALCKERDVPRSLASIGSRIANGLESLAGHPRVADLRQLGGIVAYDLVSDEPPGYLSDLTPRLRATAIEHGVLLRPLGNVVYAMPPACTSEEECDAIAACMRALADVV